MTSYAIIRLINSHAEPMRGNIIELFEEKEDAYDAGRNALGRLATGQRLVVVQIIGTWTKREGFDYAEAPAPEPGQESNSVAGRVPCDLQDDALSELAD